MSEQLEQTQEIPAIVGMNNLLNPEVLLSELSNEELEQIIHDSYEKAKELLDDPSEALHDALGVWRAGMSEHRKRVDEAYRLSRRPSH